MSKILDFRKKWALPSGPEKFCRCKLYSSPERKPEWSLPPKWRAQTTFWGGPGWELLKTAWKDLDAALPQKAASSLPVLGRPRGSLQGLGFQSYSDLSGNLGHWLSTKSLSFPWEVKKAQLTFKHRASHSILPPRSHCTVNQNYTKVPPPFTVSWIPTWKSRMEPGQVKRREAGKTMHAKCLGNSAQWLSVCQLI